MSTSRRYNVHVRVFDVPSGGVQVRVAERTAASRLHAGHSLQHRHVRDCAQFAQECYVVQNVYVRVG